MIEPGAPAWRAARLLVALFCVATMGYAFTASSAFAAEQFLKPRVFNSVGLFADWHTAATWAWFACAVVVVWPDAIRPGRGRGLARGLIAVCAVLAAWNTFRPVLPSLAGGLKGLIVGAVAVAPLAALSLMDHVDAAAYLRHQSARTGHADRADRNEDRLFTVFAAAAVFVTVLYTVWTSIALAGEFEPDLMGQGLAVGFAWSLVSHLAIAGAAFVAAALLLRIAGASFLAQYFFIAAALAAVIGFALRRAFDMSLALPPGRAAAAALIAALAIVATWSGIAVRILARRQRTLTSGADVFFGPPLGARHRRAAIASLLAVALAAAGLAELAGWIDWDFLLLKAGVTLVWLAAFGVLYRFLPLRMTVPALAIAASCVVPLALTARQDTATANRVLERYEVYNPSYRLAASLLKRGTSSSSFDRYLRAHSGFTDREVAPVDIDFVPGLERAAGPRPDIYFFVVDSLRPDYLSPYNPAVTFTPRLEAFARDSVVFTNAYTRYGGTGLSMPAMWAGSALLHKQYVRPFHPMNALEKLLEANGYRRAISRDHITEQLLRPTTTDVELNQGVPEMQLDLCGTLQELQVRLRRGEFDDRPLFAHTRSLNMHLAVVKAGGDPPARDAAAYRGFHAPYAAGARRMDACFGAFVDFLKATGRYRRSVIILTSDHGEMLGEDGRFGHSYHLLPPVIRVPLLMHLPEGTDRGAVAAGAVTFTTDITPALYETLGYQPIPPNRLAGRPVLTADRQARDARTEDAYVLAASYGAVYAVLRRNATRLYIVSAITPEELAFERRASGAWERTEVSPDLRMINQLAIRRHIDEVAQVYRVAPGF